MKSPGNRAILFIGRSLLIVAVVVLLLWFIFGWVYNATMIFLIVNDGMENRAEVILHANSPDKGDESVLIGYFTTPFLQRDYDLYDSPYMDFTVSTYDYTTRIRSIRVFPWSDTAEVIADELVSRVSGTTSESGESASSAVKEVPQWEAMRYEITMIKTADDRWMISDLSPVGTAQPAAGPSTTPTADAE